MFEIDNVTVSYGGAPGHRRRQHGDRAESGDGVHRPVRLRQDDAAAVAEPDERPDPQRVASTARSATTATTCTAASVDPVEVRRRIGMVFQRPNPFHKSIFDNVAFGIRLHDPRSDLRRRVEQALRRRRAVGRGQGPDGCLGAVPVRRPAAAAVHRPRDRRRSRRDPDGRAGVRARPVATQKIEDLIAEIKDKYTIVIVTHNMQQASRVADMTAFFSVDDSAEGERHGILVEYDRPRPSSPTPAIPVPRLMSPVASGESRTSSPRRHPDERSRQRSDTHHSHA